MPSRCSVSYYLQRVSHLRCFTWATTKQHQTALFHLSRTRISRRTSFEFPSMCSTAKYSSTAAGGEDFVDRFGIVAAMSRNCVIGVNRAVPWRLPRDVRLLKELTRNKIIILGRNSYEEDPNKNHISHAHSCIVVSTTLPVLNRHRPLVSLSGGTDVFVVRSFPEALRVAKALSLETEQEMEESLNCWVLGGERIYEEALRHEAAQEVHLSVVDTEIDVEPPSEVVALFPPRSVWGARFRERSRTEYKASDDSSKQYDFTYYVYERQT